METNDKYGIGKTVKRWEKYFSISPTSSDHFRSFFVAHIWSEVYMNIEAEEDNSVTIHDVLNLIQLKLQTKLEIEVSCGLFYITKVTLPGGVWYFFRRPDGFFILPMYKSNYNWSFKINHEVNALVDMILEFDRHIPDILSSADRVEVLMEKSKKVREITVSTAQAIASSLQQSGKIDMPLAATITFSSENIVTVKAGRKRFECPLNKLESNLLKKFPADSNN